MRIVRLLATALSFGFMLPGILTAQGPELRLLEPMENATVVGDTINVIFEVPGITIVPSQVPLEEAGKRPDANRPDEGHLHLRLDLEPVVIWGQPDPYMFTNVLPGNHILMVEVVNNDHSPRTPPLMVERQVTIQAGTGAPPANTIAMMPHTAAIDVLAAGSGRFVLLIAALVLINLGSMLRLYQSLHRRWLQGRDARGRGRLYRS